MRRWLLVLGVALASAGVLAWLGSRQETRLWAIDAASGHTAWFTRLPADIFPTSAPGVDCKHVVAWMARAAEDDLAEPHLRLMAWSHDDGSLLWTWTPDPQEWGTLDRETLGMAPYVANDHVVAVVAGSRGRRLVVLDAGTGMPLTTYERMLYGGDDFSIPWAIAGDRPVVITADQSRPAVQSLGLQANALQWEFGLARDELAQPFGGPLLLADVGTVYVGTHTSLYALDASNGQVRWQAAGPGRPRSLTESSLIRVGPSQTLSSLDTRSGIQRWSVTMPGSRSYVASVTADDQGTYALTALYPDAQQEAGYLIAFDASGREQWRRLLGDTVHTAGQSPALDPQRVFVVGSNTPDGLQSTDLLALQRTDGTVAWRRRSRFDSSAVLHGEHLFVINHDRRWHNWLAFLNLR